MVGAVYNGGQPYSTERNDPSQGEVARYARSEDYHDVLGRRLDSLVAWMREQHPDPFEARAYVDTGPVQERVYAQYAGLGWIGKNTCLINSEVGSWILLGAIICSLPLETDAPALDQCGTCTLCLEACPTGAFVAPHVLDATRCISYLTIEYRGSIPRRVSRCDRQSCLRMRYLPGSVPVEWRADQDFGCLWSSREDLNLPSLIDFWRRSDEELAEFIADTPMTRTGVMGCGGISPLRWEILPTKTP